MPPILPPPPLWWSDSESPPWAPDADDCPDTDRCPVFAYVDETMAVTTGEEG